MTTKFLFSKATDSPLPLGDLHPSEASGRARVREILASGGLKDGLDITKCVALGASLGGMAGNFLKAAAVSTERTVEMMNLTKRQIEVTMFASGIGKLKNLIFTTLVEN